MNSCYVIGKGAVSNLAVTWPATWLSLLSDRKSAATFADSGIAVELDCVVGVAGHDRSLQGEELSEGCSLRLAASACREAIRGQSLFNCLGIYGGSTHGESDVILNLTKSHLAASDLQADPVLWRSMLYDPVPLQLGAKSGEDLVTSAWVYSSCTSSMHALLFAFLDLIDANQPSTAIVVGVDALSAIGVAGFSRAGAATRSRCLPFSELRDGTMVSEGAAALLLSTDTENKPAVSLLGIGMSTDAGHPTHPDQNGNGLETAINLALERAGLTAGDLEGVVFHGTGTRANDEVEARVYQRLMPPLLPATSIKGAIGHTMGAAGLFNCLVAVEACETGLLPPTCTAAADVVAGVNLVTGEARRIKRGGPILVNCSGFGGNNVVAVFGMKQ